MNYTNATIKTLLKRSCNYAFLSLLITFPAKAGVVPQSSMDGFKAAYGSEKLASSYQDKNAEKLGHSVVWSLAGYQFEISRKDSTNNIDSLGSLTPWAMVSEDIVNRRFNSDSSLGFRLEVELGEGSSKKLADGKSNLTYHLQKSLRNATGLNFDFNPDKLRPFYEPKHRLVANQKALSLRSNWSITELASFDVVFKLLNKKAKKGVENFVDVDLHLAWKAHRNLQVGIIGKNLLDTSKSGDLKSLKDFDRVGFAYMKFQF